MSEMKYTVLIAGLAAASLVAAGCEQRVGSAPPNPPTTIINKTEPNPNPPTTIVNKSETTTQSGQPDQSSSSSTTTTTTSSSEPASSDQKATASAETKNAQPSKDTKSSEKQPG